MTKNFIVGKIEKCVEVFSVLATFLYALRIPDRYASAYGLGQGQCAIKWALSAGRCIKKRCIVIIVVVTFSRVFIFRQFNRQFICNVNYSIIFSQGKPF